MKIISDLEKDHLCTVELQVGKCPVRVESKEADVQMGVETASMDSSFVTWERKQTVWEGFGEEREQK